MARWEPFHLAVESPIPGIVVVRVAGQLTRLTAPRLARLMDHQLRYAPRPPTPDATAQAARLRHIVVDLAGVSTFGVGGLSVLSHARHVATRAGIGLILTGLDARLPALPGDVGILAAQFSTLPTLERALEVLAE